MRFDYSKSYSDKILKKWTKTPLLEKISEENKRDCSILLEETEKFLNNKRETLHLHNDIMKLKFYAHFIFVLIVRIYDSIEKLTPKEIYFEIDNFYEDAEKIYNQNPSFNESVEIIMEIANCIKLKYEKEITNK
jgi:hypothetical protein